MPLWPLRPDALDEGARLLRSGKERMLRKLRFRVGVPAIVAAGSVVILATAAGAPARVGPGATAAATRTIVIWTDRDREADLTSLATAWAKPRCLTVEVVAKAEQYNVRSNF